MTEPIKKQPYPESGAGDDWWPFDDNDLDDNERDLEAAYIPKACRPPDPEWAANLARHRAIARATLASAHPGRIPEGMPCPPAWLEYIRNGKTPPQPQPPPLAEG